MYTEETGVTRHGSQTYQSDQFRIEQVLLAEGNPEIVRIDIVDYPDNVFYQLQDITTVWFRRATTTTWS